MPTVLNTFPKSIILSSFTEWNLLREKRSSTVVCSFTDEKTANEFVKDFEGGEYPPVVWVQPPRGDDRCLAEIPSIRIAERVELANASPDLYLITVTDAYNRRIASYGLKIPAAECETRALIEYATSVRNPAPWLVLLTCYQTTMAELADRKTVLETLQAQAKAEAQAGVPAAFPYPGMASHYDHATRSIKLSPVDWFNLENSGERVVTLGFHTAGGAAITIGNLAQAPFRLLSHDGTEECRADAPLGVVIRLHSIADMLTSGTTEPDTPPVVPPPTDAPFTVAFRDDLAGTPTDLVVYSMEVEPTPDERRAIIEYAAGFVCHKVAPAPWVALVTCRQVTPPGRYREAPAGPVVGTQCSGGGQACKCQSEFRATAGPWSTAPTIPVMPAPWAMPAPAWGAPPMPVWGAVVTPWFPYRV